MKHLALSLTLLLIPSIAICQSNIEKFADSIFGKNIDSSQIAGASIIVYKKDEILLKKAYGKACLEFDVPMPVDGKFEIGSVTKQFTAVAILKLVEDKKLSLDDDFTDYLEFDTRGRTVTINNLLNHTSGIPGYTEMSEFWDLAIEEHPRDTLVRMIEAEDFMFEPGERQAYNNSAFFFLGLIIEKVTGKTYEDYLKEVIFEPLGMHNTSYCSNSQVVSNKVYGYKYSPEGLKQKEYLNHLWPYSGGSLCSTTEDLLIWLTALHQGKVFSDSFYQTLITPGKLNDGSSLSYAMALDNYSDFGNHRIGHGGAINGFLSDTRYYPANDLYIITLVNTMGPKGAHYFANEITWQLLDKKEAENVELDIDTKLLEGKYLGAVRGDSQFTIEVKSTSNGLTVKSKYDDEPYPLDTYIGNNTWARDNARIIIANDEYRLLRPGAYYVLKKVIE